MAPDAHGDQGTVGALRPAVVFRRVSARDPFPPCRALMAWPVNFPAGELADLSAAEAAETEPSRFVYSDAERDGWRVIVQSLLDELEGPRLGWRQRWVLPPRGQQCDASFRAFLRVHHPSLFGGRS